MGESDPLIYGEKDGIAFIEINRPEKIFDRMSLRM